MDRGKNKKTRMQETKNCASIKQEKKPLRLMSRFWVSKNLLYNMNYCPIFKLSTSSCDFIGCLPKLAFSAHICKFASRNSGRIHACLKRMNAPSLKKFVIIFFVICETQASLLLLMRLQPHIILLRLEPYYYYSGGSSLLHYYYSGG
jgi:hypothetical protein